MNKRIKERRNLLRFIFMPILVFSLVFSSTSVYAKDTNLDGDTGGGGEAVAGSIVIPQNPTQGVRVTVIDILNGANKQVGNPINFLQSKPKAISGVTRMSFDSQDTWKLGASKTPGVMFGAVIDPGVPADIESKYDWGRKDEVLNSIAKEMNMKIVNPVPTDPKLLTADILNQGRYKIVIEPISEVVLKHKGVSLVGTVSEHLKYYLGMDLAGQKAYIGGKGTGIGGYIIMQVPQSTFTQAEDTDLKILNGSIQKSSIKANEEGARLVLGTRPSTGEKAPSTIGGTGIGIISFPGDVVNNPDKPVIPPATSASYRILKDYVNGTWDDRSKSLEPAMLRGDKPEDGEWVNNEGKTPAEQANIENAQKFKAGAQEGDLGIQINQLLGNRIIVGDKKSYLMWSNTFNSGTVPQVIDWLQKGARNTASTKDSITPKSTVPNSFNIAATYSVERLGDAFAHKKATGGCKFSLWLDPGNCPICGGELKISRNQGKDTVERTIYGYSPSTALTALNATVYDAEPTVFAVAKSGETNPKVPDPVIQGSVVKQHFTLPTKTLDFYPSYKMNYHTDLLAGAQPVWMSAQGKRTLETSPEIVITMSNVQPTVLAPWSKDKADVTTPVKTIKSGNAISLMPQEYKIETRLTYYVTDKFYDGSGNQTLTTNQDYLNVVNTLTDAFKEVHLYSNEPLTGTIAELNTNKNNLKWLSNLSAAVRKKSLTLDALKQESGYAKAPQASVSFSRSNLKGGIDGLSKTTFNGATIPADAGTSKVLTGSGVMQDQGWYQEEYEGLIRVVITRTATVKANSKNFVEVYRAISDWQDKSYKAPNSPIRYYSNNIYTGADYVLGYGFYFPQQEVSNQPIPELKLYSLPATPFAIRGSTFDQIK